MSDGPLRDLRRGAIRSVPLVVCAALLGGLARDLGAWLALTTCALVWVPLALLEGRLRSRALRGRTRLLVTVGLAWAVMVLVTFGAVVQMHYVRGIRAGLDPVRALQSVDPNLLMATAPLTACVGLVFVTCSAAVVIAGDPTQRQGDLLRVAAAQVVLLALGLGAGFAALDGSFLSGFVLGCFLLPLLGIPAFGLAAFPWVTWVQRFEARRWPPEPTP